MFPSSRYRYSPVYRRWEEGDQKVPLRKFAELEAGMGFKDAEKFLEALDMEKREFVFWTVLLVVVVIVLGGMITVGMAHGHREALDRGETMRTCLTENTPIECKVLDLKAR